MNFFTNRSIRIKLKLVILSTTLLAVVFVFVGFFTYERITFRKITANDLETKADIIAENINAALAFQDSTDAARVLNSLRSQPRIMSAVVYDNDGTLFAVYTRSDHHGSFPQKPEADVTYYAEDALVLYKPIVVNDNRIGTIYLQMDLLGQKERFWSYVQIAFLVLLGSLAVAYTVATVLEKAISKPIVELASVVQRVSEKEDYSIRASKMANDETGFLADSFNRMLDQIQRLNADLEQRVIDRTAALRESEERYRTLIYSMDEGFCIIEVLFDENEKPIDYRFLEINPSFEKHTGLINAQGKRMREIAPNHEENWFEIYGKIALTGEPARFENRAEQLHRWYDVYAFRFEKPENHQVAILFNDITDRKKSEEAILNSKTQLETVNKELEAFSYSVSHDLRAPLRHIDGFAQLLHKKYYEGLNEQAKRYIDNISGAAKKMGQLIDELLVFSRMGRTELRSNTVQMDGIVQSVIDELTLDTEQRDVTIEKNTLPPVHGDSSMLRLVWTNLLSNAYKYTGKTDKAMIHIGYEKSNNEIIFSVKDNGAGFDMKYAEKLFGVFQRLHRSDDFEGIGIGLANVRRIVERHHGRAWAEGEIGKGATFYFSLPLEGVV